MVRYFCRKQIMSSCMNPKYRYALASCLLLIFSVRVWGQEAATYPYQPAKESIGQQAMVVSAHPLASKAGVDILKKGGNAIDATVAVQFVLAVVYPQAGNVGGGGFLVYRDNKGGVAALDYRETAPDAASADMYLDKAGNVIPKKSELGPAAAGVPGTVEGMWTAHQKYGRLPWAELVQPAVALAENGFQITAQEANNLNEVRKDLLQYSSMPSAFTANATWAPGDWLVQKDLAEVLKRVRTQGQAGFYTGATADLIVREMAGKNGLITLNDLKNYRSVWRTPLIFRYKKTEVIAMPPPSSGGLILRQLLEITARYPMRKWGFHSAKAVHLMVEAERRAYSDRAEHMGDPGFWKVPVDQLVDKRYLKKRMADFNPNAATPSRNISAGLIKESEQTTHYSIVDSEGNAAAVTTTLNNSYGSRCVVAGAGFILNNEMDDFSVKPGSPNIYGAIGGKANAIAPGKRPLSSMTPTILTKKGKLWMVLGTPGGTTIPTSVFQIIANAVEFDMPLPEAVQSGRFHHQWKPDQISVEDKALSETTLATLRAMGHEIKPRGPIGRVEAILRLADGRWQGVADKRGDDSAMGF